ncbi:MAG TPA: septal ring lytic transglycosylase RlpA family protein [Motiliproteus sp.]
MRYLLGGLVLVLVGCATQPPSRYSVEHDHGPAQAVDLSHVADPVPRWEPHSRSGNRSPYQVLGKHYRVLESAEGFREQGIASWYGNKFHGHLTSNGETYDMYAMSAAHKHLPLPSYVRVTNLANGRQVIVRVNDRGPFHEGRVIDLSYAAASRLGMLQQGTARVSLEAITPAATPQAMSRAVEGTLLQVGAFSSWDKAQAVKARLTQRLGTLPISVSLREGVNPLYRVRLGPLPAGVDRAQLDVQLAAEGLTALPVVDLP